MGVVEGSAQWLLDTWLSSRVTVVLLGVIFATLLIQYLRQPNTRAPETPSPALQEKATWLSEKSSHRNRDHQGDQGEKKHSKSDSRNGRFGTTRIVSGRRSSPKKNAEVKPLTADRNAELVIKPYVFYASLTGTTKGLAEDVYSLLKDTEQSDATALQPELLDLSYIDLDEYFLKCPTSTRDQAERTVPFYLVLLPSYDTDSIITNFLDHLQEVHNDFRIDTAPLSSIAGYAVFGVGSELDWPPPAFCRQAIQVDKWMAKLTGRRRAYPLGTADTKCASSMMREWTAGIVRTIRELAKDNGSLGEGISGSGAPVESDDEELEDEEEEFPDRGRKKRVKLNDSATPVDLEDVGGKSKSLAVDFTTYGTSHNLSSPPTVKPMVPKESPTYAALTKQGYTIVGTHSGVKICRWTKSALRGRGSCYKNSFYGIASHLCMETTPSLSCSNKCVFCWRHGTNPVSTTWRWQVDDPKLIFDGAKEGHYKKIKMMRGVPGVRAERFEEAMRIRHCALSLVGEPIFYPHINEFTSLLHGERISSFLVCNAQHPAQLRTLQRVTQLYVSIDASNKDSLRKIDRPLHRDFWERFCECLDILNSKRFEQRTVFRLTLVKGFNIDNEVEGYADLVAKGLPCFVEVKGVTYCGTTTAAGAGLTMQNVPFYEEVVAFVEALDKALAKRGLEYGIGAEHAHSCCILLASKRFFKNDRWHTRIDYEKFFELLESGRDFVPEDYCAATPEWALWGNGGFDPRDQRVDRKGRAIDA